MEVLFEVEAMRRQVQAALIDEAQEDRVQKARNLARLLNELEASAMQILRGELR